MNIRYGWEPEVPCSHQNSEAVHLPACLLQNCLAHSPHPQSHRAFVTACLGFPWKLFCSINLVIIIPALFRKSPIHSWKCKHSWKGAKMIRMYDPVECVTSCFRFGVSCTHFAHPSRVKYVGEGIFNSICLTNCFMSRLTKSKIQHSHAARSSLSHGSK